MSEVPQHQQTHVFAANQAAWETLARKVGGGWYASSKPQTQYRSQCGEYFEASRFRSERAVVTCPRCRELEDERRQTPYCERTTALEPTRHRTYRTANNYLLRQGFERRVETGTWVHRGKRLRATQHWRGLPPYLVEITYEPLDQKGKGNKAPSTDAVAERTPQ